MAKKKLTLEDMLVPVDEIPYDVPENWCWVKLECICDGFQYGYTAKATTDEIGPRFIRITDLDNGDIDFEQAPFCEINEKDYEKYRIKKDDILVARMGSVGINGVADCDIDGVFASYLIRLQPKINSKYLKYILQSDLYWNQIFENKKGTTRANINAHTLRALKIPIPPLAEQERIVNRIESLFEKVDRAAELVDEARDGFEKRRAAILEMAFNGELTKKWREENSVSDTYKVITNELEDREKIYKGLKKKDKPNFMNYNINSVRIDKSLPNGWINCDIGLLCDCIVPGRDKPKSFTGDIPWITIPNLIDDYIDKGYSDLCLSNDEIEAVNAKIIPKDSVVMSCVGRFGISSIVKSECVINQQLHAFLPSNLILPKYLMYHIRILKGYMEDTATSTTVAYLNKNNCNSLPINLPSIEEQREIVNILDSLLSKENELDNLTHINELIDITKKSILTKAFRGELGSNDLNEESSIELLKELIK